MHDLVDALSRYAVLLPDLVVGYSHRDQADDFAIARCLRRPSALVVWLPLCCANIQHELKILKNFPNTLRSSPY